MTCTVSMKKGNDVDIIKSITATVYINRFVLLYIRKLMFIVLTTEASYLPFLNIESRSTVRNLTGVDDGDVSVTLPSELHFGNNTFTTAYVRDMVYYMSCYCNICRSIVMERLVLDSHLQKLWSLLSHILLII